MIINFSTTKWTARANLLHIGAFVHPVNYLVVKILEYPNGRVLLQSISTISQLFNQKKYFVIASYRIFESFEPCSTTEMNHNVEQHKNWWQSIGESLFPCDLSRRADDISFHLIDRIYDCGTIEFKIINYTTCYIFYIKYRQ